MTSNPNPFSWGIGWRAFILGASQGDFTRFKNTMEVCSNFTSIQEMRQEGIDVVMRSTPEERKTMIPDPVKAAQSVDILRWAMD